MPNIATVLKGEILRLARKEVRKEIETLKKANSLHRSEIVVLKRRVASLEKHGDKNRQQNLSQNADADRSEPETIVRYSATRLTKHREKLGLSAATYGKLIGVSAQTIYNWESEKSRPRKAQLIAIASIRKLGKRQIKAAIGSLENHTD